MNKIFSDSEVDIGMPEEGTAEFVGEGGFYDDFFVIPEEEEKKLIISGWGMKEAFKLDRDKAMMLAGIIKGCVQRWL